ncbi:cyclophilin-like fold protein [Saccharibacillus qingshengii]|uniref:cyclophilin-like fold protein n=1 Tax=Saccharibacillus qingshengii TaxID=1763540 RepID=UPI001553F0E6|nr:cyclophilin-like fold protein [Saccharibacillus qingshengii]
MFKILNLLGVLVLALSLAACSSVDWEEPTNTEPATGSSVRTVVPVTDRTATDQEMEESEMIPVQIEAGGRTFTAALYNNEASQALIAQFPLTIRMKEHHGTEKYYDLAHDLPAQATESPATIRTGDIMGWSRNTLVLFYQTFSNSYGGYVPLGRVENPSDLADALGTGNVQVIWSQVE